MFPYNFSSVSQVVDDDQDSDSSDNQLLPDRGVPSETQASTTGVSSTTCLCSSVFFIFSAVFMFSLIGTVDASPVRSVNLSRRYLAPTMYNLLLSLVFLLMMFVIILRFFLLSLSPQVEVHGQQNAEEVRGGRVRPNVRRRQEIRGEQAQHQNVRRGREGHYAARNVVQGADFDSSLDGDHGGFTTSQRSDRVASFLNMSESELRNTIRLMADDVISIARDDGIVLNPDMSEDIFDAIVGDLAANVLHGRPINNRALLLRVVNSRRSEDYGRD
ncbi:hypothetical protein [Candidatus Ichthyocystis sparus]|nr:hypothetical protein [Candidatus Ichthyocystis sparus]